PQKHHQWGPRTVVDGIRPRKSGSQQTPRWREQDSNLYGAFPVKGVVLVLLRVLCSERESRSSSRRLRSGSRSARKGSRDRNASAAWRRAALASLVFRSALTPEHAEGRWNSQMGFSSKLRRLTAPVC